MHRGISEHLPIHHSLRSRRNLRNGVGSEEECSGEQQLQVRHCSSGVSTMRFEHSLFLSHVLFTQTKSLL